MNKDERNKIVEENLGLVHSFLGRHARYYNNTAFHKNFTYEDAFQSAVLGLIAAVDSYEEHKDITLAAWAERYMLNKVTKELKKSLEMTMQEKEYRTNKKIEKVAEKLKQVGEKICIESIAEKIPDVKTYQIADFLSHSHYKYTIHSLEGLRDKDAMSFISTAYKAENQINSDFLMEVDSARKDLLSKENSLHIASSEQFMIRKDFRKNIHDIYINAFTDREFNILMSFHENRDSVSKTKKILIEKYGYADVTEDEIRRTWSDAPNKICHYCMCHPEVAEYMDEYVMLYTSRHNTYNDLKPNDEHMLWAMDIELCCEDYLQ